MDYPVLTNMASTSSGRRRRRAFRSRICCQDGEAWRSLWDELGVPADEFIRTTEVRHARTVQWLFKLCRENGYVYPGHYTGQYLHLRQCLCGREAGRALSRLRAGPPRQLPRRIISSSFRHFSSRCWIFTRRTQPLFSRRLGAMKF